jgi:hypothetical protein
MTKKKDLAMTIGNYGVKGIWSAPTLSPQRHKGTENWKIEELKSKGRKSEVRKAMNNRSISHWVIKSLKIRSLRQLKDGTHYSLYIIHYSLLLSFLPCSHSPIHPFSHSPFLHCSYCPFRLKGLSFLKSGIKSVLSSSVLK